MKNMTCGILFLMFAVTIGLNTSTYAQRRDQISTAERRELENEKREQREWNQMSTAERRELQQERQERREQLQRDYQERREQLQREREQQQERQRSTAERREIENERREQREWNQLSRGERQDLLEERRERTERIHRDYQERREQQREERQRRDMARFREFDRRQYDQWQRENQQQRANQEREVQQSRAELNARMNRYQRSRQQRLEQFPDTRGVRVLGITRPLNLAERRLYFSNPGLAVSVSFAARQAEQETRRRFGRSSDVGLNNAFRHALWSALLTRRVGPENAALITTAHEKSLDNSPGSGESREIDNTNNWMGIRMGRTFRGTEAQLADMIENAARNGRLRVR